MKEQVYERLPGRGRRVISRSSTVINTLWLGADHLLSLDSASVSETYRRFYYRDIEAFIIRRTGRREAWNWFFLLMAVVVAGGFYSLRKEFERDFVWWVAAAISSAFWALLILINMLRGPTCVVHIRTAVQVELLPSLRRMGRAEKVLQRLRPRIESAQGRVGPEQLAGADWSVSPAGSRGGRFAEPVSRGGAPRAMVDESGRTHTVLFGLMFLKADVAGWAAFQPSRVLMGINVIVGLATMVVLIGALRRQSRSGLPPAVKRLTWATLGYYGAVFAIGKAYSASLLFRNAPGYFEVWLGLALLALAIGAVGSFLMHVYRSRRAEMADPLE